MKRIDVVYGGIQYSVGGRDVEDLKAEIVRAVTAAEPQWIVLNDGEGQHRPSHLLLQPGVPVALIPIPDETGD